MTQKRTRLTIIFLFTLFMLPIAIAVFLALIDYQPKKIPHTGLLLNPPEQMINVVATNTQQQKLQWDNAAGNWYLLIFLPTEKCMSCSTMLDNLHRARLGLNRKADRLHIYLIGSLDAQLQNALQQYPEIKIALFNTEVLAAMQNLSAHLKLNDKQTPLPAFLIDPHGYWVMHYTAGFNPIGLRNDLKRLIR